MKQLKILALTLACVVSLAASLTTAAPRKRGVASCCNMKRCCYENKRCCKKANHACCTGKAPFVGLLLQERLVPHASTRLTRFGKLNIDSTNQGWTDAVV